MEASRNPQDCEICEKSFKNEIELLNHEDEHQTCGLDGCTFTADPEVIFYPRGRPTVMVESDHYIQICQNYAKQNKFQVN